MKEPRVLATGLSFPEGPVALADRSIVFTEMEKQCLTRYAGGVTSTYARTAPGTNGATVDGDGAVWVACNGGLSLGSHGYWKAEPILDGALQRVAPGGTVADVGPLPGDAPHRPNDLCFGPDGKLYFTDPRNWEDLANLRPGRICRYDPASGTFEILAELPLFPNGIAFGPDPSRLYVLQTMGMKVFEFPWTPAGLGEPREFAALPRGFPDGFCFAADGDAYICGATADVIQVVDADGSIKETIEFSPGTDPLNCCLLDGTLYVTCAGRGELLALDVGVDPLPLFPVRSS